MEARFRNLIEGRLRGAVPSALRGLLRAAAAGYGLAVTARNWLYDAAVLPAHRVQVPVISVGNLTLGGTGKTPLVEYLCRWFQQQGRTVAVLSRGYGADCGPNDEALVLEANLTGLVHVQGPDRVALAAEAVRVASPDVLILDDGFQHRRLARDLDIVLLDALEPFGFGYLFPRGLLREPPGSLARADLVVLTRAGGVEPQRLAALRARIRQLVGNKPVVVTDHVPVELCASDGRSRPVAELAGKSVAAFCGIGNPKGFWSTLERAGCRLEATRVFPDHHRYTTAELDQLGNWLACSGAELAVTTQKDLVKIRCRQLGGRPLWAVRIRLQMLEGAASLHRAIAALLSDGAAAAKAG